MDKQSSPMCTSYIVAQYEAQRLPQFKGNPMIEALPPSMSDEQLYDSMCALPEFTPEQRSWSKDERLQMLMTLSQFMIPLKRHLELARTIDTMMRSGYVGRAPRTPEFIRKMQNNYLSKFTGVTDVNVVLAKNPQLSTLLMGVPGVGKTTATRQCFSNYPQVIWHPDLNVYQITYIQVEMPSDGASIKGLAHGIFLQLDKLIPGANYYETYALRGKPGADTLMRSVSRVLNQHFVGFLVADEVQNLANSFKGKQTVMTELVSACNDLGVPILFIGTNKAAGVFSTDFRQSRRAVGYGLEHWDRLHEFDSDGKSGEWYDFLEVLWGFQWVKKPICLNARFSSILYDYSQGVIDIAIKLLVSAQAQAISDGSEKLSEELFADVYFKQMMLIHPMIDALRENNIEKLVSYPDLAHIGINEMLHSINIKLREKASKANSVSQADSTFEPRITASLVAAGFDEDDATAVAKKIAEGSASMTLVEGITQAIDMLKNKKSVAPKRKVTKKEPALADQHAIDDYRTAIDLAKKESVPIYDEMHQLGLVKPLKSILKLS
jgi:hypothetical protein